MDSKLKYYLEKMACSLIGTSAEYFKMVDFITAPWKLGSSHTEENPNVMVDRSITNARYDKAREVMVLHC